MVSKLAEAQIYVFEAIILFEDHLITHDYFSFFIIAINFNITYKIKLGQYNAQFANKPSGKPL